MIQAKDISLQYADGTMGLYNSDFTVKAGEFIYIVGPSGSGKTSLLKLLMGIEFPSTGSLYVMGQAIRKRELKKIRNMRRHIGPIFQEFKLIQGRTAYENVIMGMRFLDIPKRQMKLNAKDALERVGLENKSSVLVERLSFGEAQRVAIARAIARKPALILADEPTGNLDQDNAINIMDLLNSIKDKNTTVLVTTHATHLIDNYPNASLIRIEKGRVTIERRGEQK
ncbi:MAG: ATP-binding cassette domain-containing protein [Clostridiaceae bacterium]|jgi:cell division transport system ATP-binding protein|nr:ATP-binding cassette domain-containing protein [Clostridiaceae bacterium]